MDIFSFAINMEHEGEKYYRKQAEINQNNSLHTVCLMLAEDEHYHALILSSKQLNTPYVLKETDTLSKAKNIFADSGDIKIEGKEAPSQLDFYRIASDMEKQSIDLYTDLLSQTGEEREKELFRYLIAQEKQHFEVLEELVSLLRHAEEWVESAEFGIREEY